MPRRIGEEKKGVSIIDGDKIWLAQDAGRRRETNKYNTRTKKLTYPRLVPSDSGVDYCHARILQRLRQRLDFVPRATVVDQIEHTEPEYDDEIHTARLAGLVHDVQRESHAIV